MTISAFKQQLQSTNELEFYKKDGTRIPAHFHITEVGVTTKHFIDCGGTDRIEQVVSFQLWVAHDTDHRLDPNKLLKIIDMSAHILRDTDYEVEAEYQNETIGRYGIEFENNHFVLIPKQTNCLAQDQCGIPPQKANVSLSELQSSNASCCTPGGGCC
jgi:hypothetical protein